MRSPDYTFYGNELLLTSSYGSLSLWDTRIRLWVPFSRPKPWSKGFEPTAFSLVDHCATVTAHCVLITLETLDLIKFFDGMPLTIFFFKSVLLRKLESCDPSPTNRFRVNQVARILEFPRFYDPP